MALHLRELLSVKAFAESVASARRPFAAQTTGWGWPKERGAVGAFALAQSLGIQDANEPFLLFLPSTHPQRAVSREEPCRSTRRSSQPGPAVRIWE